MRLYDEYQKDGVLDRIRQQPLETVELAKEYNITKTLGEGFFAKILLATHRRTNTTVVLKAVHTELTNLGDFYREFHYSYHMSPHPNILSVYAVAFRIENFFVFAQEFAPLGDLAGNVKAGGLPEESCKKIAQQLSSALEFLHSKELVHRDLKLENVLVFAPDMSKIKLCDFGSARKEGTTVTKIRCAWHQFLAPEVCEVVWNEPYEAETATDVWQMGVVIYVCLTGHTPWQLADYISDPAYSSFYRWQRRKTTKIPVQFKKFTPRLMRLFKKIFEHKYFIRGKVTEFNKYIKDNWLIAGKSGNVSTVVGASLSTAAAADIYGKTDSNNMYLRMNDEAHVSDEVKSKGRLRKVMDVYGLETTIDQNVMAKRIWEWVLNCDSHVGAGVDIL